LDLLSLQIEHSSFAGVIGNNVDTGKCGDNGDDKDTIDILETLEILEKLETLETMTMIIKTL